MVHGVSKVSKIYEKVLNGQSDANVSFEDLCYLLERLGFNCRQRGTSHRVYQKGVGFVNVQPGSAGKAKPYQVAQAREVLKRLQIKP